MTNKIARTPIWNIGSFTKNFGWGKGVSGLERLHSAINIGFAKKLVPTPRDVFWNRLEKHEYIPHIPTNFFTFNKIIENKSYVFPDELAYQAITKAHSADFDKLALFSLFISENGKWKGARQDQEQPSEWARYFILDELSKQADWSKSQFSRERIEEFLDNSEKYKGGNGTRKLATNLSYLFRAGELDKLNDKNQKNWMTNAIFLALDRYFLKTEPAKLDVEWAIDQLTSNDVLDFSDILRSIEGEIEGKTAKLYVESRATGRLDDDSGRSIFGVISRDPLIYKELPSIVYSWLKKRIFIELADAKTLKSLAEADSDAIFKAAINRIHNKIEKPILTGDQLIMLVRGSNDNS